MRLQKGSIIALELMRKPVLFLVANIWTEILLDICLKVQTSFVQSGGKQEWEWLAILPLAQSAAQTASNVLSVNTEAIAVEVSFYFSIYIVQTGQLNDFCENCQKEKLRKQAHLQLYQKE